MEEVEETWEFFAADLLALHEWDEEHQEVVLSGLVYLAKLDALDHVVGHEDVVVLE